MMDLRMKWICLNILDVLNPVLFDVHTIGVVTSIKESNISRMQQMEQDNFNFFVYYRPSASGKFLLASENFHL